MKKLIFILFLFLNLIWPNAIYSQSPSLGSLHNFTLFTAVGAFANTGASVVTGDIGTHVGAFSGFPPGILYGQIHVADTSSFKATKDLDTIVAFFNAVSIDTVIGTILGNNQILPPHVYGIGALSHISDTLYLDAQGDSTGMFVFFIDAAFSTQINAHIVLINQAKVTNVFWIINGALSIYDSSVFYGTAIVNGAVNIYNKATVYGRVLSTSGAISVFNSVVDLAIPLDIPLPIKLYSFKASSSSTKSILIEYQTIAEINSDYIEVEKLTTNQIFESIYKVETSLNSVVLNYYSYLDSHPQIGNNYYRLKFVDLDCTYSYSQIISCFNVHDNNKISLFYPNPFSEYINVGTELGSENYTLKDYNASGTLVFNYSIGNKETSFNTTEWQAGIYYFQLHTNEVLVKTEKLCLVK